MNDRIEILRIVINAHKAIDCGRWEAGNYTGKISLSKTNIELVRKLDQHNLILPLSEDITKPKPEIKIDITLQPHRKKSLFFAKDLNDILENNPYKHSPPECFYLADIDIIFPENANAPQIVKNYIDAARLSDFLKSLADHYDDYNGPLRLIYLHKEKLEIQVEYTTSDLCEIEGLEKLTALLSEDTHKEQRRAIFKEILLKELKNVEKELRFKYLLNRFQSLLSKFHDNYQLYVSEFSFEKVFKEINEKKLEHILRINKNFSEIQNQLLASPIAVLLARSQMAENNDIRNYIVIAIVFTFAMFISMLLRNQRASLEAIYNEIKIEKDLIIHEHAAIATRFDSIYDEISMRYKGQISVLLFVDLLIGIIVVAIPTLICLYYNHGID